MKINFKEKLPKISFKLPDDFSFKKILPTPFRDSGWHTAAAILAAVVLGCSLLWFFNFITAPKEVPPAEDIVAEENVSVPAEESEVAE